MKFRYLAIVIAVALLMIMVGCAKTPAAPLTSTPTAPAAPAAPVEPAAPTEPAAAAPAEEVTEAEPGTQDVLVDAPTIDTGKDVTVETQENKGGQGLAVDLSQTNDAFKAGSCDLKELDGKQGRLLTVEIQNIEKETWVIYGKVNPKGGVRIGNRGVIDIEPGCEKMTLEPGESTVCNSVNNGAVIQGENRVTVNTPDKQYARVVMCP